MNQRHKMPRGKGRLIVGRWIILFLILTGCRFGEGPSNETPGDSVTSTAVDLLPAISTPTPDHPPATKANTPTSSGGSSTPSPPILSLEFVSQIGGRFYAVFVQGDFAYVGVGPRLMVLDISDPTLQILIGETDPLPAIIRDIYISGSHAYVTAREGGLYVFDVSTPSSPVMVRTLPEFEDARNLAIDGENLFLTMGGYGTGELVILDITDPAIPVTISRFPFDSDVWNVFVAPPRAYTGGTGGLSIIDITDPAQPSLIASGLFPADDVYVSGNYAFLAGGFSGLTVVDISDPMEMTEVDFFTDNRGVGFFAESVYIQDNYAFIGGSYGLVVFDIYNPLSVYPMVFYDSALWGVDVHILGSQAYLAAASQGLKVIDISRPDSLEEIGSYPSVGSIHGFEISGDFAYVQGGAGDLFIIDMSDPSQPRVIDQYPLGTPHQVFIPKNIAYLTRYSALEVVDISDPIHPQIVGTFDEISVDDVFATDSYVYIGGYDYEIAVLDMKDPSNPWMVTGIESSLSGDISLTVHGSYAYLTNGEELHVVDVSDPDKLELTDSMTLGEGQFCGCSGEYELLVDGSYAYVANGPKGLAIVDISDPYQIVQVGTYDERGHTRGLDLMGSTIFIAAEHGGLQVLDISDPLHPREILTYLTPGDVMAVRVVDPYIYLADASGGLVILRLSFEEK